MKELASILVERKKWYMEKSVALAKRKEHDLLERRYLLLVEFHPRPSEVSKTCMYSDEAINKMAEHQR